MHIIIDGNRFQIEVSEGDDLVVCDPGDGSTGWRMLQAALDAHDMRSAPPGIEPDARTATGLAWAVHDMTGGEGGLYDGSAKLQPWDDPEVV